MKPIINTSENRANTPLSIPFERIGTLVPRSTNEIKSSNWTLGCEVLDRDFANYEEYKEYIVPLGIKTIRLQGGWAKSEPEKGVYNFAWLDKIIDDATGRGLNILLETGYGNPIYEGGGGWDLGAGFPTTESAFDAWDNWVEAMAVRYSDRVTDWAMWNEPDISKDKNNTPANIAELNIRTAKIIKKVNPNAHIAGLSLASVNPEYLRECLEEIKVRDGINLFKWFIIHGYTYNPGDAYERIRALQKTVAEYSPDAILRQGENGCPSEVTTFFALRNHPWTEMSQAKWDLRRMLGDLGHDMESSVFTFCDFNHKGREINRKGLLHGTEDLKVDGIKLAYYAVQNCVSVFDHSLARVKNSEVTIDVEQRTDSYTYRNIETGKMLVTLWDDSDRPSDSYETTPVKITMKGITFDEPVWVDLVSGRIYTIPAEQVQRDGESLIFTDIPFYDSPMLIAERSLVIR